MKKIPIVAGAALLLATATVAQAEMPLPWGLRAGYAGDTDYQQLFVGAHAQVARPLPNTVLQPSVEVGFGDDLLLIALNVDLFYEFTELAQNDWSFYAGGGVAINYFNPADFSAETEFGLNLAGGVGHMISRSSRLVAEVRIGLEDAPDVKVSLGVTFF
jgi:hypothetical protein